MWHIVSCSVAQCALQCGSPYLPLSRSGLLSPPPSYPLISYPVSLHSTALYRLSCTTYHAFLHITSFLFCISYYASLQSTLLYHVDLHSTFLYLLSCISEKSFTISPIVYPCTVLHCFSNLVSLHSTSLYLLSCIFAHYCISFPVHLKRTQLYLLSCYSVALWILIWSQYNF